MIRRLFNESSNSKRYYEFKGRKIPYKLKGSLLIFKDVYLNGMGLMSLRELPWANREWIVKGDFSCSDNNLTSLKGVPVKIGGNFYCGNNNLKTLEGAPSEVGDNFVCNDNNLITLKGAPKEIGLTFSCYNNNLKTLEGAPKEVGSDFDCSDNTVKFTKSDVKKVSEVWGKIYV